MKNKIVKTTLITLLAMLTMSATGQKGKGGNGKKESTSRIMPTQAKGKGTPTYHPTKALSARAMGFYSNDFQVRGDLCSLSLKTKNQLEYAFYEFFNEAWMIYGDRQDITFSSINIVDESFSSRPNCGISEKSTIARFTVNTISSCDVNCPNFVLPPYGSFKVDSDKRASDVKAGGNFLLFDLLTDTLNKYLDGETVELARTVGHLYELRPILDCENSRDCASGGCCGYSPDCVCNDASDSLCSIFSCELHDGICCRESFCEDYAGCSDDSMSMPMFL